MPIMIWLEEDRYEPFSVRLLLLVLLFRHKKLLLTLVT